MSTPEQQLAQSRELAREQQYRLSELADNIAALRGALRETDAVNEKLRDENAHLHEGMAALLAEQRETDLRVQRAMEDRMKESAHLRA